MADAQIEEILRTMRSLTRMPTLAEGEHWFHKEKQPQVTDSLIDEDDLQEQKIASLTNDFAINADLTDAELNAYENTRAQSRF